MKKASKATSKSNGVRRQMLARDGRRRDELRPYYDFSCGVRGKYAKRTEKGTNLVLLEPDIAAEFRSDRAVNRALREYLRRKPK